MIQLFAQPYDLSAAGFYFESFEEHQNKATKAVNDYGDHVEEFEIQFIDREDLDCELAKAWETDAFSFIQTINFRKRAGFPLARRRPIPCSAEPDWSPRKSAAANTPNIVAIPS